MEMNRARELQSRIRLFTGFFIFGLFISGATAIPLVTEVDTLTRWFGGEPANQGVVVTWLGRVRDALAQSQESCPFLFYGTDWLAFGHFIIALVFVGALIDPVRNKWLFSFGMMACALVIPFALTFGALRGIPFWWRLVDCSFGVAGFVPVWLCKKWADELELIN